MIYALSWFAVVSLLALWSLAAWAAHAVVVWTLSRAGSLSGADPTVGGIAWPDWLVAWLPTELVQVVTALGETLAPLVDGLLQVAPVLAGGATVVIGLVWGIGSLLLLLLGAGLHVLLALWRHRGSGAPSGAQARRSAGTATIHP